VGFVPGVVVMIVFDGVLIDMVMVDVVGGF